MKNSSSDTRRAVVGIIIAPTASLACRDASLSSVDSEDGGRSSSRSCIDRLLASLENANCRGYMTRCLFMMSENIRAASSTQRCLDETGRAVSVVEGLMSKNRNENEVGTAFHNKWE
jgi:hypothetical protein